MKSLALGLSALLLVTCAIASADSIPPDPIISPRKGTDYTWDTNLNPGGAFTLTIFSNGPTCTSAGEGVVSCGALAQDGTAGTQFGDAITNNSGEDITQLFYLFRAFNAQGQMIPLAQAFFGTDSKSIFNVVTVISPFEAELSSSTEPPASIPVGGDFTNFMAEVLVPEGGRIAVVGAASQQAIQNAIPEPGSVSLVFAGMALLLFWRKRGVM